MCKCALFISALLIGFAATAHQTTIPSPIRVTAKSIGQLSPDELLQLEEKFNALLQSARNLMNRDGDEPDLTVVRELAEYQIQESVQMLLKIFESEVKRTASKQVNAGMNLKLVNEVLSAIERITTNSPSRLMEDFLSLKEEAIGRLGKHEVAEPLNNRMDQVAKAIGEKPGTIIDFKEFMATSGISNLGATKRLDRAQSILEARLIGQPEVVQALMDLEWRSSLYGKSRQNPDAIYLMGLSSTGKDTAAEAFTDALNGFSGAHNSHLFRLPVIKRHPDLWRLLGSSTGYMGSDNFPDFLEFLVRHSSGRYKTESVVNSQGKTLTKIVINPEYRGKVLEGYSTPESAVVFANQFQNWSKTAKDDLLGRAIANGTFTVQSPNGGLSEIFVPVRFVIASSEGSALLTSREANGQRQGKPLTFDQILKKWEKTEGDKPLLKNEILATNGLRNTSTASESAPGISQELLSLIPDRFVVLMRPLSPENLQEILKLKLEEMAAKINKDSELLRSAKITWDEELTKTLQEYYYTPDENAKPVLDRITTMIEEPLIAATRAGKIKPANNLRLKLSISTNPDQSRSLSIEVQSATEKTPRKVEQLIRDTLKDRPRPEISDERIDELANLEPELKNVVFGIDSILERLAQRIVSIENESGGDFNRKVNLILLSGLSSTGKTETAKQLSIKVSGADDELATFDFSQIQTLHDFKTRILGLKDDDGNPIPSDFMKLYDRNNGKFVVAFDELANVRDIELLKCLYDLFRQTTVTTFSDGRPRPMGGVTIIITGNPGQEMYNGVPRDVPMEIQMDAWQEIYQRSAGDLETQRKILERFFPEPLITRIGRNNIFFVPPHNYRSLRQLSQLKLAQSLERIRSTDGRRGWDVVLSDVTEYALLIDTIIEEGFSLRYQGASIDSFISDDFEVPLSSLLLLNKVPSKSRIVLNFNHKTANDNAETPGFVYYDVWVDGRTKPLVLSLRRPHVDKQLPVNSTLKMRTAFHESGHSIVRTALFHGAYTSTKISIRPGVSLIGNDFVYFLGIARSEQNREISRIRDAVVREIAIMAAGETAERLISRGATHGAGKQNDMERASQLARDAVLRYGLSETWGTHSIPSGMTVDAYTGSLSEKQKGLLEREAQKLIREGRELAQQTLEANFEQALVPLGILLTEEGELDADALKTFYVTHPLTDPLELSQSRRKANRQKTNARQLANPPINAYEAELIDGLPTPKKIANIEAITKEKKQAQYDSVPQPESPPIGSNKAWADHSFVNIVGLCEQALTPVGAAAL